MKIKVGTIENPRFRQYYCTLDQENKANGRNRRFFIVAMSVQSFEV